MRECIYNSWINNSFKIFYCKGKKRNGTAAGGRNAIKKKEKRIFLIKEITVGAPGWIKSVEHATLNLGVLFKPHVRHRAYFKNRKKRK